MAWLAKLDAKAARFPLPLHWLYLALKWSLLTMGAVAWIGLWWQRHPLLGLSQVGIIGYGLWHELRPQLRGQRTNDLPRS